MKELIVLFVVIFFSCSNSSSNQTNQKSVVAKEAIDSLIYSNKEYKIVLYFVSKQIDKFKLYNLKNNFELLGKPELITIDGEIPEGTNRIDYNNPNDFSGYPCDSTYRFISGNLHIAFATVKETKKRLDLQIEGFPKSDLENGGYTLLRQN